MVNTLEKCYINIEHNEIYLLNGQNINHLKIKSVLI